MVKQKNLLNLGRNLSYALNLNLVVNQGKAFIMDNHLAAAWCWLNIIDNQKQYNLFHIDRHYDLLPGMYKILIKNLKETNTLIQNISIEDLTKHKFEHNGQKYQSFQWDNYFWILSNLYPNLFAKAYFCTHKEDESRWNVKYTNKEIWDLPQNLSYTIKQHSKENNCKWILNLDADFFT